MNIEKHLILVKNEDKTQEISYCKREGNKYNISFDQGKIYSYGCYNVQWFSNPTILDPSGTVIYQDNMPVSGVEKIFDFGEYIRVCFVTGYKKVYRKQEIKLEQSCLNNANTQSCFEYLKQLADKVSVTDEGDHSFLSKQYEHLAYISPSSVLAQYLNPELLNNVNSLQTPIFPFGFNLSQKEATEKALTGQLSVIEGPPGTGKTQTILNIIANAVINGKTVAVVSNNNAATANVLEKLQKYNVDFIAAYLGNRENKNNFFAGQAQTYPNMESWIMNAADYQVIKESIEKSSTELIQMLETKNRLAILKQNLSELTIEQQYFNTYYQESNEKILPFHSFYKNNSKAMMDLMVDFQWRVEEDRAATFLYKIKNLILHGIYSFSYYKNSNEKIIACFQKLYYEYKSEELNNEIQALSNKLDSYCFDLAIAQYTENSMKLFKAKLAERFSHRTKRQAFENDALWKQKEFESFIQEYPVILSTTHSLRSCACENYLFDYVIMDEASQVDIVTGALALSCARNAVIVGDLKQLPNVVPANTAEETNRIFEKYTLNMAYRYASNSMLSSVTGLFHNVPRTLLKEHYRCHPKIIGFCNQKFYNNELIVMTEEKERDSPLVVYKTAMGNHARGNYNQRQIDVILNEVFPQQSIDETKQSVGVISPYRLQTDKLKEALGSRNIEVDTVHKFQGREKNVIILSTVVNEVNEFVDNPNLLNVAVSRSIDKLIVVVSDDVKQSNSNIGDLVRYIEYNNFKMHDSKIYSVFDLLYHSYSENLLIFMKRKRKVSKYESEDLMNAVIEKVLALPEFSNLDRVMHQPLKMLIRDPKKLDDNECRFAMNILTHTDFVIFNKLDKMPVLVVEVDGYAFHANNPKQLERDKMKDTILQKYDIPILRIKTNESGEEVRLHNKLTRILSGNDKDYLV